MEPNKDLTFFGLTSFRNQRKRFGIKRDDRRRHFYTIGKTGMGKSNLMENMAIQDIQNGNGIAYVDPHGEGAEKLLDFIPNDRIKDVIFFNPADLNFPIAFNVMEKVDFQYRHLVAGGLMGVFKKVWPDVWSARMEYILNNTILALLEYPKSTLLGVNRMLSDPEYRKKVVAEVRDPVVKAFWETEYARYSQKYETEATAAIQNKVGQFVSNALIRNIIGQEESTINLRQIMDSQKILILDLSKGRIGEDNSRLLGALLITKIQLAAMSRVDIPEPTRKDFYLYVDEFQNFATESFANILSEARKYRLNLIVGHQYINQMDELVRDAVFGNVGTLAVFRVGAEDAEFLEKEFSPEFTAEDLVNSTKYTIYLKLMIDGVASHPFSAYTLPPPLPMEVSNRDRVIDASRATYGVTRDIVENRISHWMSTLDDEGTALAAKTAAITQEKIAQVVAKKVGGSSGVIAPRPVAPASAVSVKPALQPVIQAPASATPAIKPVVIEKPPVIHDHGGESQEDGQTKLHDAICSICGKPTKVIFEPKEGRPIYCKSCMKKIKSAVKQQSPQPEPVTQNTNVAVPVITAAAVPVPPPQVKVEAVQQPAQVIEIDEPAEPAKIENVSFGSLPKSKTPGKNPMQPTKRKEINLADLRKALETSLEHRDDDEGEEVDEEDEEDAKSTSVKVSASAKASAGQAGVAKAASAQGFGVAKAASAESFGVAKEEKIEAPRPIEKANEKDTFT